MFVASVIASKDDGYLGATGGAESMALQIQPSVLDVENGTIGSINRDVSCQPQVAANECVARDICGPSSEVFVPDHGGPPIQFHRATFDSCG